MEFTHTRFGKCKLADITQGQLEQWQSEVKGATGEPMAVFYGKGVRAAINAKMLIEPAMTVEQVSEKNPGLIQWLAQCIGEAIFEASNIDPLS